MINAKEKKINNMYEGNIILNLFCYTTTFAGFQIIYASDNYDSIKHCYTCSGTHLFIQCVHKLNTLTV